MKPEHAARSAALSARSERLHLAEFWNVLRGGAVNQEPKPACAPHIWRYKEVIPQLHEAADLVPVEEAERRAVVFKNPALGGRIATTHTMYAAYSLYNPGERAMVHRHTINAGRIGLSGSGGYTTVQGVKCMLSRGDIVLTPNWCWHDHGNDGREANIWFDFLDQPLAVMLGLRFFDVDHPGRTTTPGEVPIQTPDLVLSAADNPYAAGTTPSAGHLSELLPAQRTVFFSYRDLRSTLASAAAHADPFDAVSLYLRDSISGGPVLSTMDVHARLLPGGMQTQATRQSASAVFLVMEGSGKTEVGDTTIDWEENDVFVVPNWTWFCHQNRSATRDAVLYEITDAPLGRSMDSWRREGRAADGTVRRLG